MLNIHRQPFRLLSLAAMAVALPLLQSAAKRPLTHRDYDGWRAIQGQALSRDGKFLAYALFPQEGDGQLVVRNLATGKELRENAGTPPPPRESADPEGPPPDLTPGAGIRIIFTHDSRFAIAVAFPPKAETEKAAKERKRPEEMPHNGMLIVDLAGMSASRVPEVTSFQVPEAGESFLATGSRGKQQHRLPVTRMGLIATRDAVAEVRPGLAAAQLTALTWCCAIFVRLAGKR